MNTNQYKHPFLKCLQQTQSKIENENVKKQPHLYSCLSKNVENIIEIEKSINLATKRSFLNKNGLIDLENFSKSEFTENDLEIKIPAEITDPVDKEWYIASIKSHQIAIECQKFMQNSNNSNLNDLFPTAFIKPLPSNKFVLKIHEEFQATSDALVGFGSLVTIVERFLGDVFTNYEEIHQPNPKLRRKPPPLIRDLLQTSELNVALGSNAVFLLQIIIGSARSLNLRNILWHGFITSEELKPRFYYFLLVLHLSIVSSHLSTSSDFKTRELRSLSDIQQSEYDFGLGSFVLDLQNEVQTKNLVSLFESSNFIIPGRSDIAIRSMNYIKRGDSYGCYFALVLLLPLLEHCLRRFWLFCNVLAEPLLFADSYRYYTILDMFLEQDVDEDVVSVSSLTTNKQIPVENNASGKTKNLLVDLIGEGLLSSLCDTFYYPNGPRPRDKISHGDVDPETISETCSIRCFEIFVALCLKLNNITDQIHEDNSFKRIEEYYDQYRACFHPYGLLQKQLRKVLENWNFCLKIIRQIPLFDRNADVEHDEHIELYRRNENMDIVEALEQFSDEIVCKMQKQKSPFKITSLTHVNMEDSKNENNQTQDYINGPLLKVKSLWCDNSIVSVLQLLTKLASDISSLLDFWTSRLINQYDQVKNKKATTRLESTFYKLLGILNAKTHFFSVLILIIENGLHNPKSYTVKDLKKMSAIITQLRQKIQDNRWDELLELIDASCISINLIINKNE